MNKFNKSKKIKIWVSLCAMLMFLSGVGLVYKAMAAQSITVTISSSVSSPTNLGEIPIFVDFSQNVTGFDISDISYGNATIDNFRMYSTPDGYGYGYGYTFNLHPQSQGASTVSIGADKATDINNNTNLASNNFSIIYDTIPPVISGVSIPTGTYKIGSEITATITADAAGYTAGAITINGVSVTNFTDATGGSYTVKYTVASGDTDRTSVSEIPISVVLTDAAGNSSEAYTNTPTGGTVTIDAHAPTNQNDVFSANTSKKGGASVNVVSANETGGSIWFAPYGTTSFISGDTMTTAGGTATSINSPATAGEYRLFVIDASGNVSSASTAVLTVDSTAPSGYTVTIDQAYINNSNKTALSFTFSGAELGSTYNYSISSSGGGTAVTGSGTIATATDKISSIDVSSLNDGTLTLSVTLTDVAGNVGAAATNTAIKDIVAPTITSITSNATSSGWLKIGDTILFTLTPSTTENNATVSGSYNGVSLSWSTANSGVTYTATYTVIEGNTDQTTPLQITGVTITDAAGNTSSAASGTDILKIIDAHAPVITINNPDTSPAKTKTITASATSLTGMSITTGSVCDGTLTFIDYASTTFNSGSDNGKKICYRAKDSAGNISYSLSNAIAGIDTTPPTITITSNKTTLKAGETALITFTLSEAATDFTNADVSVSGGSLSNFSGSGTSYTATFTPTASSTANATIDVAGSTFTDAAGNNNTAATQVSMTVDTLVPIITITSNKTTLKAGETALITFTLSEAATDFTNADVSVSGGSLSNFSGSGTSYTATFTPTASSTANATIDVAGSTFTDAAGNNNTAATQVSMTVDTLVPIITITSNKTTLKAGETALITFTLSEAATDFTNADVSVSGGSLSNFSGSGTSYTATFTPTASSTANATIDVAGSTFTDAAGNNNTAATQVSMTVDTLVPTITITSNKTTLKAGETALITFTLSEAATDFTNADVSVSGGSLSNFSGSDTSYTATFTPTALSTANATIDVAGSTFTDAAGNNNTAATQVSMTVDTLVPIITITSNKTTLKAGETALITFTLSEAATDFTNADVSVSGGSLSNFSGSGTSYTATFTPTASSTANATIDVAGSTFTDAAGNNNTAATQVSMTVDTLVPTITSITSNATSSGSLKIGDTITFTLTPGATELGATAYGYYNGVQLTWSATDGGAHYTATYTVANGDASHDSAIQISNVTLTDAAGNVSIPASGTDVAKIIVDASAPVITITIDSDTSPAKTKTITADVDSGTGTITGMYINNKDVTTCDNTLVFVDYSSITFTSESDNGKRVCYRAEDSVENITYKISDPISGIDTTPPVITITGNAEVSYGYGFAYTDPGATATDNIDTSVTVTTTGFVNPLILGDYTLTYNATDTAGNTATATRLIHIIKADQTITFDTLDNKVYGDADFGLTATASSGLDVSLVASGGHCTITGSTLHIVDVGTCTITASQSGNDNYNAASNIERTFSITPKPITVTAVAKTKVYGETDPTLTYTVSPALISGDTLTGSLSRATGETVGSYDINQGDLANTNYTITFVSAKLSITPKPITVTAEAKTKVYGETDPTLTYTVSPALISGDTLTGSLSRATGETVGSYDINQGDLANTNYTITFVSAKLSITPKPITVTAEAKTKEYGAADPTLTYTVSPALISGDTLTGSLSRATGETVGSYDINQGDLANTNYTITFVSAKLSITPKPITVTAEAKTKVYGETDPTLTYTVSPALISGDTLTGSLSRATGETVGSYDINQGDLANTNYTITFVSAKLSITPKPITVTAEAKTKEYGAADPTLTYTVSPALISGDTLTGSLSRATGEAVGDYAITSTLANANYAITFVPAKLSIVDTTAPNIAITNPDTTTATSKTITATTSDGTLTMSITTGNTCDGSLTFIAYAPITFNSESDNGKKVCYKAVDAYNNTRYSLSNAIAGISIPSVSTYSGGTPISFCSNYVYSEWGTCVNGIQTRTIVSKDGGSSCSTSNATLSQTCITQPVVVNPVTPVTPVIPIISEPTKPVVTTPPVVSEKTTIYSPKAVQLKTLNVKEDKKLETSVTNTYLNKNIDVKVYGKEAQTRILNFIVYGTQNNKYLSYQDRINVINDLKKTLGRAPTDEVEWTLAINAANDLEDEQLKIKEQKAIKLNKEKIPGPSKIKLYKNIEQIGSDLWGNKK